MAVDAVVLLVVHDVEYILVFIRKDLFALVKVANKKIKFREMLFVWIILEIFMFI
jgi:hypothetical protein